MGKYRPQRVLKRIQTKRKTKGLLSSPIPPSPPYMLDLDEIYEDGQPENAQKIKNRPPDEDLPGSLSFLFSFTTSFPPDSFSC